MGGKSRSQARLDLGAVHARLGGRLDNNSTRLLEGVLEHEEDGASALWLTSLSTISPITDGADLARKLALVVVEKPVSNRRSLALTFHERLGFRSLRNRSIFVFLGAVRCRDLVAGPGTIAIFARGLEVERLAVFDGMDSHVQIADHLRAPRIVSGHGGGGAVLSPGCTVDIGQIVGSIANAPRRAGRRVSSLAELIPELGNGADSGEEAWALVHDRFFPKVIVPEPPPRRPRRSKLHVTRHFENRETGDFWAISVGEKCHIVRFGRIGTAGRVKTTSFAAQADAFSDADRLVEMKRAAGYVK